MGDTLPLTHALGLMAEGSTKLPAHMRENNIMNQAMAARKALAMAARTEDRKGAEECRKEVARVWGTPVLARLATLRRVTRRA
jgi:hypothetical protein